MDNSKLFGEAANEEQLLKNDYRKYRGENMDIYYNVAIFEHAGECVRGNPLVFEVGRKPMNNSIIITHTGVSLDYRGQGLAEKLVLAGIQKARREQLKL